MDEQEKTYEWLIEYQRQSGEFIVNEYGCGMTRYRSRPWGNKGLIVANEEEKRAWMLVYPDGRITGFNAGDFDMESIKTTGCEHIVERMTVDYMFDVEKFKDGKAVVTWMLRPEGSYYADEGGFGRTDDGEVCIYAVIDTHCQVVKKFQASEDDLTNML